MERDLWEYENEYLLEGFEDYQVIYRRKKVLELMGGRSHRSIIEIGCGMYPLFLYIEDFDQYVLFEPSDGFYKNAVKVAGPDDRIKIIHKSFDYDKALEGSKLPDYIICSSLLHELADPQLMLDNIRKYCTRETIVHINVPNANSFHRLFAVYMGLISNTTEMTDRNKKLQQNTVFDLNHLCTLVKVSGFEVIDKGSYFIKPFTHAQMWELLTKHIIDEKVLDGLYDLSDYMKDFGSEIYVNCKVA